MIIYQTTITFSLLLLLLCINMSALADNSQAQAYLVNDDYTLTICNVNDDATLDCQAAAGPYHTANLAFYTAENEQQYAYVANTADNSISVCGMADDGQLSCNQQTLTGLDNPQGIGIYQADNGHSYLYISNYGNGELIRYQLLSNGHLLDSHQSYHGFNKPTNLAFHLITYGKRYAYIINDHHAVSLCKMDNNGELVMPCEQAHAPFPYTLWDIAFHTANNGISYAYLSDGGIRYCQIDDNGNLYNCQTTNSGFDDYAEGIAFHHHHGKDYAYITNFDHSTVSYCQINYDGGLTNCQLATGSQFLSGPGNIVFNQKVTDKM